MSVPFDQKLLKRFRRFQVREDMPVEAVVGTHSVEIIFRHIEWNLRHCRRDGIIGTLFFLRDVLAYSPPKKAAAIRKALPRSNIWTCMRELLYHRNDNVRRNAIYTVGKIGSRPQANLLKEAFPCYLKSDPIHLSHLMSEMNWLARRSDWKLLNQIVEAPHYLQRWSLCDRIYDQPLASTVEVDQRFLLLFQKLAKDENLLVAAEAARRSKELQEDIDHANKTGRRSAKVRTAERALDFSVIVSRFIWGREAYTLAQLDRFVKKAAADRKR